MSMYYLTNDDDWVPDVGMCYVAIPVEQTQYLAGWLSAATSGALGQEPVVAELWNVLKDAEPIIPRLG
jgi:hypothetical protein